MDINASIAKLACYAVERKLISPSERIYSINLLLALLNKDDYAEPPESFEHVELEPTLKEILDYAVSEHLIAEDSIVYRDLFDTAVMNCFVPRPQTVINTFTALYQKSPKKATDWYYRFSQDSDYIRSYRVAKDLRWKSVTPYGKLDITINLSKPEKDPKAIAAAKLLKQSGYPECQLCKENEGYRGRLDYPARETIRIIPVSLDTDPFFLQYSPYSYYNEHCIVFNTKHIPMIIDEKSFRHLFDFITKFPHYMLGSNADLPIVGGSILTHDHYQGGRYDFPMFRAQELCALSFRGFDDVKASYLQWPLSVIRLSGRSREELTRLSVKILATWRVYSDSICGIFATTEDTPHNTITPIAHRKGGLYVMDLVLRNNLTTEQYPLGVFHPHPEYWNIKKENIGLIEVMGLAVLPSRLKEELAGVRAHLLKNEDVASDALTAKHADWVKGFLGKYPTLSESTIDGILKDEVGLTFQKVLECAGVYKQDPEGLAGLLRFVADVNER
jgi:UDPglucose--hexose-1-phosphate uridylyltransferase